MSLIDRFAPKTLCVGLAPGQLTCVIRKGKRFLPESAFRQDISNADSHWQPILNGLRNYLQQLDGNSGSMPIRFTLSSRWCRMMMVPWSDALLDKISAADFLQSQFLALYGDAAREWTFTTDDAPYGQTRLACGIERELLQSLQQLAIESKHWCQSVEPVISIAWRTIAHLLGQDTRAIAIVEPGQLSMASMARGRIAAVQSQACDDTWYGELANAWQRWILRMPELADIPQVAVLNLSAAASSDELPNPFKSLLLPTYGLESGYDFVTCSGSK